MSRIRMFVAALVAAFGMLTFVNVSSADAIVVHLEVAEDGINPNAPPPEPATGAILNLCLTVRAYSPNPVGCLSI